MKPVADRLDSLGRRHPLLVVLTLVGLTVVATLALLFEFRAPAVVYEFF